MMPRRNNNNLGMMLEKEAMYWSAFVTAFMCDPIHSQRKRSALWVGRRLLLKTVDCGVNPFPGLANLHPRPEYSLCGLEIGPKLPSLLTHELVVFATLCSSGPSASKQTLTL